MERHEGKWDKVVCQCLNECSWTSSAAAEKSTDEVLKNQDTALNREG